MNKKVGKITENIIDILKLDIQKDTPIFIGDANIEHIKLRHLEDYKKYGDQISNILENPTYVVRASGNKKQFVRTMYIMAKEKIEKYKKYGYFKKI